jgi:co-chaperonin GroES (HSP10)
MNIQPLGKRVLVERIQKEELSKGGTGKILMVSEKKKNEPFEAKVLAIGHRCQENIKVGDVVFVPPYSSVQVGSNENLMLLDESVVLGVF